MAILTERGKWANSIITESGQRVFSSRTEKGLMIILPSSTVIILNKMSKGFNFRKSRVNLKPLVVSPVRFQY